MGDVINLRKARKEREKAARQAEAAANRAAHGRTKAEKDWTRGESDLATRRLDGHLRGPARGDEPDESA